MVESSSDSSMLLVQQLLSRLEKNENAQLQHTQNIERRLEQLVELMQTVAQLQSTIAGQNEDLVEVRQSVKELDQRTDKAVTRLHDRIDEQQKLFSGELKRSLDHMSTSFDKITASVSKLSEKADAHEKDWKQWFNRGWGVFVAVSLVVGFAQAVGARWIDSVERSASSAGEAVKKLELKVTDIESLIARGGSHR